MTIPSNLKIGIIGLGYVGLPLAFEFQKKFKVVGFDINEKRIKELISGNDSTEEIECGRFTEAKNIIFTSDKSLLRECTCFIVTVPTPVDNHKQPDLTPLLAASQTVGEALKFGDVVIYESTVYPGATEDDCVPILEYHSSLLLNKDFGVGYSPERINPGDKINRISSIVKITSGSDARTAAFVDELYKSIIEAGTYRAESIKVAEAAKVVENTQRDLNIALMNELAIIFNRLNIDTRAVINAASTKWNFMKFTPGLVGGHCIGVDPYYLTHKGQAIGCHPEIILAGRRLNDGMASYVASQLIKLMVRNGVTSRRPRVLLMGLSFKEDCPDIRNSRGVDIIAEIKDFNCEVCIYDPIVSSEEALDHYGISLLADLEDGSFDAIAVLVGHTLFKNMGAKAIHGLGKDKHVLYDVKCLFEVGESDLRL